MIREFFEDPVYGADFQKGGAVAQTAMEKELLRLDFPLVDRGQMSAINQRDEQTAYNDPNKAAAAGVRASIRSTTPNRSRTWSWSRAGFAST